MFRHRFLLVLFPAQGHINPAFQFAKQLVTLGAHVTISTTLHMHRRITNKPALPGISFLPFSDGYDDGYTDTDYSLYAFELKRHGSEFLTNLILSNAQKGHPFTCLVHTMIIPWAAQVARGFDLPTAMFWTQPATVLDIFYYYFHGYSDYIKGKSKQPSSLVELPGLPFLLPTRDLPSFLLATESAAISLIEEQVVDLDVEAKPRILVNTFEALEAEALRGVDKFNMISIGPLIPSAFLDGKDPTDTSFGGDIFQLSDGCKEWLDTKAERSVVYVSFGSFCVLSKRQMEEVARALLDCGRPFLWVIREKEELSCGEELEEKGKIVKWCCQVEVLSHGSVGCFVTHCGWNSSMESLVSGVPVVAFPQWLEQKTNAMLIEDVWKTGVRVDTDSNEEGLVVSQEISKCLQVVMGNGEELRNSAKKWKSLAREAVIEGGTSHNNLRAFLHHLSPK
ncbi:hypothetical protein VNO78_11254 [Psophocarpus tetragonolobus]|uniref:Glycosyltransferase n=1 Tax=Psophocarpus tetragonolobus TaxID=3891 RepID=A0AAN9SL48_PSOTE